MCPPFMNLTLLRGRVPKRQEEGEHNYDDQESAESCSDFDSYELEEIRTIALREFPDNLEEGFQQLLKDKMSREAKQEWTTTPTKTPMTAYFLCLAERRKNHEGKIGSIEANKWCKQWQTMSQIQKKPFTDAEQRLQCQYQEELAEFREKGRYRVRRQ